jgi:hypothetical protein
MSKVFHQHLLVKLAHRHCVPCTYAPYLETSTLLEKGDRT